MNKERRKELNNLIEQIEELKISLETLCEEEQEYYDNMPESIQNGEKGERSQEAIDNLESAIDNLDEAIDEIQNAIYA